MRKEVIGNATLYLGDCRDILPTLGKVDAVITDPPYGENTHANAKSNKDKGHGNKTIDFASISIDELSAVITACGELCDRWFISTMEWRHIASFDIDPPKGWELIRFGVWVKTNPMPQISADRPAQGWEGIAYMHSTKGVKKTWNGGGKHGNYIGPIITNGDHPTGKPIQLFSEFVERFTAYGETVFDPFMGSGTTGVASVDMGRKFIGVECNLKYFDTACKRIELVQKQERLFA